ncbi:hypothetical protein R1flu_018871 [Riccia fluitans]|uniref:Uncharacterized protein n=1 Tax=Riccia fluitans TaxID=41844 RepID=A0ABD1ZH25_9MARC
MKSSCCLCWYVGLSRNTLDLKAARREPLQARLCIRVRHSNMVRFSYIVYLEPYKKSRFYKSLERYLMSSLAHFGLHEGTMCPPHCEMTQFFDKGDYLPAEDIAKILDRCIEVYAPFPRPKVGKMWPVNRFDIRGGDLRIPLDLKPKGVGGLVTKPYEYAMKEFRYDGNKQCNLDILPAKMDHIPLAYNYDKWVTNSAKLSPNQLHGLWDHAQEMIDFKDAETCAWHITLHKARRSRYVDRPHHFIEPVETWEICREIRPVRKWVMDWP